MTSPALSPGASAATDSALGFWLRFAESEGALYQESADCVTMLLPPTLQRIFDLPEDLAVTADPEVAREDGALLMAPGHPALEAAAAHVLDRGDVGRVTLAWPATAPLSGEALVARIRESVVIDHGRIDAAAEPPVAGYLPVLRVGALVTYTVTLDDRFQERVEVWVDATTGLPIPAAQSSAIAAISVSAVTEHRVLPADHAAAGAAAQALLDRTAEARLAALGRQSRGAKDGEVARIEAYYAAALESLERRRATAPPERQTMLDARAEATRTERARRLAEVDEKFLGSFEARWFRVHEFLLPAISVPVVVRRGPRSYPFTFQWLLHHHVVAPLRCPHCGLGSPLVAGKERLGCEGCLARTVAPVRAAAAPVTAPAPIDSRTVAANADRSTPAPQVGVGKPNQTRPIHQVKSVKPLTHAARKQMLDAVNRFVLKFWQDVANEDRKAVRSVRPDTPAAAAVRLWGPYGPAIALGISPRDRIREAGVTCYIDPESSVQVATGELITGRTKLRYTLRALGGPGQVGQRQVVEIVAGATWGDARLPPYQTTPWWLDPEKIAVIPSRRADLDPVAAALYGVELTERGVPILLRCLTAWWRATPALREFAAPTVAAALARSVAGAAGVPLTIDPVATQYKADPAEVRAAGPQVRRLLALDKALGW